MRYLTAVAATASTALLAAVQAAPSAFDGQQQQHQLTFGSGITKAATNDFDNLLADTKGLTDVLTGNYGNVVSKGAKWVKQHINDPRFITVSHAAFPEYKLRINSKKPKLCDPGVKQISGFLDISDQKHLFFWFFESRSKPSKDPLTLWLNGGPGCSSTTGLLFELGPCLIAAEGEKTVYNPSSWNEASNMIFLDQPVQVGYSYTEGPAVVTTADASKDVYAFLQLFMKSFPEYSALEFNIAGESYAGHYIPNFGSYIFEHAMKVADNHPSVTKDTEKHIPINLKSLLIGNGLTDPYLQFASVPEYSCPPSQTAFLDQSACTTIENKALYCWGMYSPLQATDRNLYDIRRSCNRQGEDGPLCYKEMGWIEKYLSRPEIKEELGVHSEADFSSCNMEVNRAFLMTGDSQHNSAALLPPMLEAGIRVLIYAGNQDALSFEIVTGSMCNYVGNRAWFKALDNVFHKEIEKAKDRDFIVDGAAAGRLISAGPGAGNYTFLEVFDAGHMVPTDQPVAALEMFRKWISNKEL
ncbi:hypothetical protein EMMF5_006507 [Cystobasidiomycetes sp. EMM_F5]